MSQLDRPPDIAIGDVTTASFTIPTEEPESDGTLQWESTPLVTVHVTAGRQTGFGYTYAPSAAETLIREKLIQVIQGRDALGVAGCWHAMNGAIRNVGRSGIGAMALSAVDCALWDLKAKLLDLSLVDLWGAVRESVPVYGSGGFTSYEDVRLLKQLSRWVQQGIPRVKMKVGRDTPRDLQRIRAARQAIGDDAELLVDTDGAYTPKQALDLGNRFAAEAGICWLEEPRSSDDLKGLRLVRDRGPTGVDIAAGEYGYRIDDFRRILEAGAVDCLQADVTRCGGFTGFFQVAALCEALGVPLSGNGSPQLHAHLGCAVAPLRHLEYFHDHVRIGGLLFDGCLLPDGGSLFPDRSRPGMGLELKTSDAEKYRSKPPSE